MTIFALYGARIYVRRVMRLPQRTHNRLLHLIGDIPKVDRSCIIRFVKFYCKLCISNNFVLKCLSKRCMYQSLSNMGKNVSYVELYAKGFLKLVDSYSCTHVTNFVKHCIYIDNDVDVARAATCHELLCIRDGAANAPIDFDQCDELLYELCTS